MILQLLGFICRGLPESTRNFPTLLTSFFSENRDRFSANSSVLLVDNSLVIPNSFRNGFIRNLHSSHPGVNSTIYPPEEFFYWPRMTNWIRLHFPAWFVPCPREPTNKGDHVATRAGYTPAETLGFKCFPVQWQTIPHIGWLPIIFSRVTPYLLQRRSAWSTDYVLIFPC